MSIKVMTMVFDRYPEGGNERLLALAMADHARDDGSRIWPSVSELARKTMQSPRTVQRQIANMVERGWLQLVHRATGRPGDTNEYRINPAWIEGKELQETGVKLTPVDPVDKLSTRVTTEAQTGVNDDERGDTAVSPESSGTVNTTNTPQPPVRTGGGGKHENQKTGKNGHPKPPWRWRDTFDGVKRRGEQLGIVYSRDALGNAWSDDELQAHDRRYRELVEAAHVQAGSDP